MLSEVVAARELKAASSRQVKVDTYTKQPVPVRIPRQVATLLGLYWGRPAGGKRSLLNVKPVPGHLFLASPFSESVGVYNPRQQKAVVLLGQRKAYVQPHIREVMRHHRRPAGATALTHPQEQATK